MASFILFYLFIFFCKPLVIYIYTLYSIFIDKQTRKRSAAHSYSTWMAAHIRWWLLCFFQISFPLHAKSVGPQGSDFWISHFFFFKNLLLLFSLYWVRLFVCVCVCVLINCRKPVVQCYVISLTQDVSWFILYVHFLLLEIRRRIEEKKKKKTQETGDSV